MPSTEEPLRLCVVDMHTAGEPVRIIEQGYPELTGATILARRRDARDRFDHLRRMTMLEPRGHAGMYGVIPTAPSRSEEHTSELQSLMRISYAVFCLKKKTKED